MRAEASSKAVLHNWQLHSSFNSIIYQSVKIKPLCTTIAVSDDIGNVPCNSQLKVKFKATISSKFKEQQNLEQINEKRRKNK